MSPRIPITAISFMASVICWGCDRGPKPTVEAALANSSLVISGKVIHAEYGKKLDQSPGYLDTLSKRSSWTYLSPVRVNEYTIVVTRSFKGAAVGDIVVIRTALDPVTDCGSLFTEGKSYVIYAKHVAFGEKYFDHTYKSVHTSSVCGRTQSVSRAEFKAITRVLERQ